MNLYNVQIFLKNIDKYFTNSRYLKDLLFQTIPDPDYDVKNINGDIVPHYLYNPIYTKLNPREEWDCIEDVLKQFPQDAKIGVVGFNFGYEFKNNRNYEIYEPSLPLLKLCLGYQDISKIDANLKFHESLSSLISANIEILVINPFAEKMNPTIIDEIANQNLNIIKIESAKSNNSSANRMSRNYNLKSKMRVLVQARSDLHINPGGDKVALEECCKALVRHGVKVDIDINGHKDASNYDLVHIYNFCTPGEIEGFGRCAKDKNVPFVVTTLYEDRPIFFNQMHAYASAFVGYIQSGYRGEWSEYREMILQYLASKPYHVPKENLFLAREAEALISSGDRESAILRRDYPETKKIASCKFGSTTLPKVDKSLFESTYGIKDYVLSVGRIEVRKNQGMLLKALEYDDIPVVLVAGKMTYNPDYQEYVSNFRRRGKTIVVKELSPEMLSSAYAGARVHALPSWYELPGLVTLEAALNGANVVASTHGTIRSYLGDLVFYCQPDCIDSIRSAVLTAFYSNKNPDLKELAASYTWDRSAIDLIKLYDQVLSSSSDILKNKIEIDVNVKNYIDNYFTATDLKNNLMNC